MGALIPKNNGSDLDINIKNSGSNLDSIKIMSPIWPLISINKWVLFGQ
jgi:hypothetical protein